MSRKSAQRRQPVVRHGQRVTGLWQRKTAAGQIRFDAQIRRNGRPTFVVLEATALDTAIAEAARVRLDGPAPAPKPTGVTVAELAVSLIADMRSRRFRSKLRARVQALNDRPVRGRVRAPVVPELGAETPWRRFTAPSRPPRRRVRLHLTACTARSSITVLRTLDRFAARRLGAARLTLELEGVPAAERRSEPDLVDESIIAKVPERHRLAAALCLFAGLRASEACGLEWRHVDDGLLTVEQQLDHVGAAMTTPKSKNSTRQVPIHPLLQAELEAEEDRVRGRQDELARRRPLEGRLYPHDRHVLCRALKHALGVGPRISGTASRRRCGPPASARSTPLAWPATRRRWGRPNTPPPTPRSAPGSRSRPRSRGGVPDGRP